MILCFSSKILSPFVISVTSNICFSLKFRIFPFLSKQFVESNISTLSSLNIDFGKLLFDIELFSLLMNILPFS